MHIDGMPDAAQLGKMLAEAMGDDAPDDCLILAEVSFEGEDLIIRGLVLDLGGVGSPPMLGIPNLEEAMQGAIALPASLDRWADDGGVILE